MTVNKQPAKRGAALASGADGCKGNRSQRQFEVSRGTDHGRIVGAELENCPREALRHGSPLQICDTVDLHRPAIVCFLVLTPADLEHHL